MTRKDYELVAQAMYKDFLKLGGGATQYNFGRADGWRNSVYQLAAEFEQDNPKFDKAKFLAACGLA